jgi:hypothetical protein
MCFQVPNKNSNELHYSSNSKIYIRVIVIENEFVHNGTKNKFNFSQFIQL